MKDKVETHFLKRVVDDRAIPEIILAVPCRRLGTIVDRCCTLVRRWA